MMLGGASSLMMLLGGCGAGGDEDVTASAPAPTPAPTPAATVAACQAPAATPIAASTPRTSFVHPGLLNTDASLARARDQVALGRQPWADGWQVLAKDGYASLTAMPRAAPEVLRPGNFNNLSQDIQRTYLFAIAWKVTGDVSYADRAVLFLDEWSKQLTRLGGDVVLVAGLQGYQWANAAEIMRGYAGWQPANIQRFQGMLETVFYPSLSTFLTMHNGSDITSFWGSWDLLSLAGMIAIGIFCDKPAIYQEGLDYFKSGGGNGAVAHVIAQLHKGHLGQWQESGRDQGHSTLGVSSVAAICEMAWNQGDDLYGYWNNRVLSGVEYVAAVNLRAADGSYPALPYVRCVNRQGTTTEIAMAGRPHLRPCWESLYNHYVNRRGLSAPYLTRMAAAMRPEKRDASGDSTGLLTLTHSLPAPTTMVAPSGVTARIIGGAVQVDWWGSVGATGYEVERSTSACGTFAVVAQVDETRSFTDTPASGDAYYRVAAIAAGSRVTSTMPVRVAFPGELRVLLPLDEGTGTLAADRSGRGANATLVGGATWTTGRNGGRAVRLDGRDGHVALPEGIMEDLSDHTIATWLSLPGGTAAKQRWIFGIGSSDVAYQGLVVPAATRTLRSIAGRASTWGLQGPTTTDQLAADTWTHVAVTLSGTTATLYIDGIARATASDVDIAPFQFGRTTNNWLGRSQFAADPYLAASLQDFRIYSRALSATEVLGLTA